VGRPARAPFLVLVSRCALVRVTATDSAAAAGEATCIWIVKQLTPPPRRAQRGGGREVHGQVNQRTYH